MKPLHIDEFKGSEVVESNNKLKANRVFYSKVNDFEGKLSQSHFSLKIPISGTENYIVNNRKYQVDETSYLITNISQEIEAQIKSKNVVTGLCISFSKEFISNISGSVMQKLEKSIDNPFNTFNDVNFITKKNRIDTNNLGCVLNKIKQDINDIKTIGNYEEEQFYISLGELLIENQFKIYSDINKLSQAKFTTREEIYRRVDIMNDFIHDNYKTNITLDELSQISCLSKYHAIRSYQKIHKTSPYQKIQMLRLEAAKQLIQVGMSIKDVAIETNFPDYRALSKQFKKHFNITPTEFKNQIS